MAFALGEDGDQHIGAGHFLAARRLDMDMRALDDALESCRRLGVVIAVGDEVLEFVLDIIDDLLLQDIDIHRTGPHDRGRVRILCQRQQEVFERRIFMMAVVGEGQSTVERLFERAGKCWHWGSSLSLLFHDAL